jgi:cell wall-associated NlpC family hydrolase
VNHTALYIGDHQYIEAAGPGVKITSFDPAAKNFDDRRNRAFCFAKRILD